MDQLKGERIQPKLRTFDLTMIMVSLVIGMGIFRTPTEVSLKAQIPFVFFAAWLVGGVVSFIGALTFAEIGSRYPRAGGFYKIFSHCYHPSFAFMVNWITVISNAASTAGVAIMGADYIAPLIFPGVAHDIAVPWITVSSVIFLYITNMFGIKVSAKMLNGLMIVKIAMLLVLISAVFFVSSETTGDELIAPVMSGSDMWKAFALCFVPVFFTYGGYQQTINFGGDIANPAKAMPRAIFIGIGIVLFLYLCVNYSYYKVLGFAGLQHTTTIASDISGLLFGNVASRLISVVMFLSVMAYINVSMMSNPRIYFAMAEDKVLPSIFGKVNPKTQVQVVGVSFYCLVILLTLFFISSFQKILEYVMFFDSISLITAAAAIFVLRYKAKKEKEDPDIYKMKGYPWLPVFYILIYLVVNLSVLMANPFAAMCGAILFIAGFPLYHGIKYCLEKF